MTTARRRALAILLAALLPALIPARAQEELKTDTPSINAIKKSLGDRFGLLKPHFDEGRIGLQHDGLIAIRQAGSLDDNERGKLDALIVDDNKDRVTLYREIARANGRADLEDSIRAAFSDRWRVRAPSGWWLREKGGEWVKKP